MIKLKNVKIRDYNYKDERSIINKIDNIEDAIKIVNEYKDYDWTIVKQDIDHSINTLKRFNILGKEETVYKTKGYKDFSLEYNDSINNCDVLIFNNPIGLTIYSIKNSYMTIGQMKIDLKRVLPTGKNYALSKHSGIGTDRIDEFLYAIEFYEKQVERQSLLTTDRNINLFKYAYEKKKPIVQTNYQKIIQYLLDVEKELVFGKINEQTAELYIDSLNDKPKSLSLKNKTIEVITNYMTIEELEDLRNGKVKVLNRFIK